MASKGVDRFISRADELRRAEEDVQHNAFLTATAKWAERGPQAVSKARWEREAKSAVQELNVASAELKARRRARLQEYYASLEAQYDRELNEMGFAFRRERF
eukprot:CAMPEP_0118887268 /NCGR_PEP_ID=MMETSP1163-20130328/25049_1 /TAXON_ID=124430 /ORGANISM="Phaeomonas parva, Strain CCMP2877" /LENGTH=101 /DNA_ID=CAMNT_0006825671 /DNA_START=107 /DNA_END=412 /DNA_ORIENTATION=-